VGDNPEGVAVDPVNGDVYVANTSSGTVSVINPITDKVIDTITVGVVSAPQQLAVATNGDVYVTDAGAHTVSVIDPTSNTVIDTITGFNPVAVAANPGGDIYVVNGGSSSVYDSGAVSVIDPSTNKIIDAINDVGNRPVGIAVNPGGDIYVPSYSGYGTNSGHVAVIDPTSNTVIDTITVNTQEPQAVTVAGGSVYVGSTDGGISSQPVAVIDPTTNTVTGYITGSAPANLGGMTQNASGSTVYITTGSNDLQLIDTSTNTVIGNINTGVADGDPFGAAYDAATGSVFVTNINGDSVSVIS